MPQMLMPGASDGRYGLNFTIFLSILLHLLVLSVFFFSSSSRPSPRWTFGPVYDVQLVGSSEVASGERSFSAPPGATKTPLSKDLTAVTKSLPDRMSPLPLGKSVTRKDQKDSVEKAVENIRAKVQASKPGPAVPKGTAGIPVASPGGPAGSGQGKGKMDAYYAVIWSLIRSQWALPGDIVPRGNIEAIVHVRILRSGAVTELSFEKRSGNRYFDESAMRAIQKASPFPPLPELGGESTELGIRFHSSELR